MLLPGDGGAGEMVQEGSGEQERVARAPLPSGLVRCPPGESGGCFQSQGSNCVLCCWLPPRLAFPASDGTVCLQLFSILAPDPGCLGWGRQAPFESRHLAATTVRAAEQHPSNPSFHTLGASQTLTFWIKIFHAWSLPRCDV